jgi:hypothetical protein
VGAWTGASLALAGWTKPNVLGIAGGLFLFALSRDPRSFWRPVAGALAVSLPVGLALHLGSHGAWWRHMMGALAQPLTFDAWRSHVGTRAMFLAPAAATTWLAWRGREEAGVRAALFAWVASLAWALCSLAKIGSASNYWMEPAVAAVVIAANAPAPALLPGRRALAWLAAAGACVWLALATLGGVQEAFEREPPRAAFLASARAACGARPGEVVVADTPGSEMAVDGRIIAPGIQMLYLVLEGRLPASAWVADLRRPQIACAIEQEGRGFHALPEVAAAFDARFVEIARVEGWRLYALRDRQ